MTHMQKMLDACLLQHCDDNLQGLQIDAQVYLGHFAAVCMRACVCVCV